MADESPPPQHGLSPLEYAQIRAVRSDAEALLLFLDSCESNRELAIAKERIEEAVMWAEKGIRS